jgi:hypothetical protein
LFVYLSMCLKVRMSARCDWSTVFYLNKGSKTPEATSDLARKNDKKTKRSASPGAGGLAFVRGGRMGKRVDTHTHTHIGQCGRRVG